MSPAIENAEEISGRPASDDTQMRGRPLRVALVHAADQGAGAERGVITLHKSLLDLGHECRLYVGSRLTNEPQVFEIPRERPVPGVLRLTRWLEKERGWQNVYAPWFRRLARLIGDVDVLHLHTMWGGQFGYADLRGMVLLSKRYPTVLTLHDAWMLTGHCACPIGCERWQTGCGSCPDLARTPALARDATALNWRRKRKAVQQAALRVTTVSSWLQQEVAKSPIFAGKTVDVVHNGVAPADFQPGSRTEARRQLQIPLDRFVVLMAGQSIEGIHSGIAQQGVEALNRLGTRATALLVGHSAPLVAERLRVPSIVHPFQKEPAALARLFRAADLTLVPSEYETFGLVAAESQMCGTPVLAFATGGLTDVVCDGVTGRLVPPGDVDGLTAALIALASDAEGLTRMGHAASIWARKRFSTAGVAEDYVRVYRKVIESRQAA